MSLGAWVISVVGVVMLTILVDIILPQGETSKYTKNVLSIIIILALIRPLPTLLNGELELELTDKYQNTPIQVQSDLLEHYIRQEEIVFERALLAAFSAEQMTDIKVKVEVSESNNMRTISKVLLNLPKKVINGKQSHIYNLERVSTIVVTTLGVEKDSIFYG